MDGTHKIFFKWNMVLDVGKETEPVWLIGKPVPSPIIMSYDPS